MRTSVRPPLRGLEETFEVGQVLAVGPAHYSDERRSRHAREAAGHAPVSGSSGVQVGSATGTRPHTSVIIASSEASLR
jgi:hypothetical protein